VHAVMNHIWRDGSKADAPEPLAGLASSLGISDLALALNSKDVKAALKSNTDAAIAAGVFGVPMLQIDDELFWGNDATDYAAYYLEHPERYADAEAQRLLDLPQAIQRKTAAG
jgi:2-hydroxychromene-2-carboxylate isomerase